MQLYFPAVFLCTRPHMEYSRFQRRAGGTASKGR